MVILKNRLVVAVIAIAAASLIASAAQQAPTAGAYTAAQATAGAAAYQANCATCHQPDLRGRGTAAPLAGQGFLGAWSNRPAGELFSFIELTMPPGGARTLGADTYANIAAFILQRNGVAAGNDPLSASTSTAIVGGAVPTAAVAAGGQAAGRGGQGGPGAQDPDAAAAAQGRGAAPGGQGRGAAPAAPPGITVAGEVRNYVPVTDAMLR